MRAYVFDNPGIHLSRAILIERGARAAPNASGAARGGCAKNYRQQRQSKRAANGIRRPEARSRRADRRAPSLAASIPLSYGGLIDDGRALRRRTRAGVVSAERSLLTVQNRDID